MAGPYTKSQNSGVIDDGWTIEDGDGTPIAHLDTELLADVLLVWLLGDLRLARLDFPSDTPLGEREGDS